MEIKDPLEDKFNAAFSGFEQEPPPGVWEKLRGQLHPELQRQSFWSRIPFIRFFRNRPPGFHIAIGGITLGLTLGLIYLNSGDHHAIRGHAYAGQVRLKQGSSVLFRLEDQTLPWDSVNPFRTERMDEKGHFRFSRLRPGRYVLLITPDRGSETAKRFIPTWYDRCERSDSCSVIELTDQDVTLDAILLDWSDR